MLDHISIGVADLARAGRFYDAALAPLGVARMSDGESSIGYGKDGAAVFWILVARRPVPADPESGLHICLAAPTRKSVDAFHKAALGAGGGDNGKPGVRKEYSPGYYAAFVTDPDGYRIEAHCGGT